MNYFFRIPDQNNTPLLNKGGYCYFGGRVIPHPLKTQEAK